MAEPNDQRIVVDDQWNRFDWKKRTAIALFGEAKARRIARSFTLSEAWLYSTLAPRGRADRFHISKFKNIHAGKRCVIIGNGPSLRKTDMSLLRTEYTFGLNRIYMMFDDIGFDTTFHVAINRYVVEQCLDDLRQIRAPLFTAEYNRPLLSTRPNTYYLKNVIGPWFSRDVSRGFWEGHTVTYVALQLAYYMGFSSVILVGVDHRFAVTGAPNQLVESTGQDASHFDPRYFGKGFKWQLPDLPNSEVAYQLARSTFERDNRIIVDSTVDGALTVFPKMSLEEALAK